MSGADVAGGRTSWLDFTSALYLGLRHPSAALPAWPVLTTGVPAALREAPAAAAVAPQLAALVGCERALLGPSTLHLFWDLVVGLADPDVVVYMDRALYPIARWGVERAAAHGVRVRTFPHHDGRELARRLAEDAARPLVVTDGFCPACGRAAPLAAYVAAARAWEGRVVIDDTQALGIFGRRAGTASPYGLGGGGSLTRDGLAGPDLVVVASLAKAFGAPIAMVASAADVIARFAATSETRVHCTPPSAAALHAAARALAINRTDGERRRARLAALVRRFRRVLPAAGFPLDDGSFPMQTLRAVRGTEAADLHRALARARVRAVLRLDHGGGEARLTFVLTARHTEHDIDRLLDVLVRSA
jgi:8-amino-7-oxononanoate synthase